MADNNKYDEYFVLDGNAKNSRSSLPRSFGNEFHYPSGRRQAARLNDKFKALQSHFQLPKNGARLAVGTEGTMPDQVVVLEVVGDVTDFIVAAKKIDGLELQFEINAEDIMSDTDFYKIKKDVNGDPEENEDEHKLTTKMFLVLSSQEAIRKVISMWNRWKRSPKKSFPHGLGKWKDLFQRLHDVRLWSDNDRIEETGILNYWQDEINQQKELILSEIELWYSSDPAKRQSFVSNLEEAVAAMGGGIVDSTIMNEIRYHGIIAKIPSDKINNFLKKDLGLLKENPAIMFFRPCAQALVVAEDSSNQQFSKFPLPNKPSKNEKCLILDGYPLENHNYLKAWINVNDLFGFAAMCPPIDRKHGTAVSSLVIHGDSLPKINSIPYKIVVTPILKPEVVGLNNLKAELLPPDLNIIDLVHRAVVKNLEQYPHIKVINFSIGITGRPFNQVISPLARLIDWLSWKYKVTFIISAGNCSDNIQVDNISWAGFSTLQKKNYVIKKVIGDLRNRRILSPAESFSGFTIGALHSDKNNPNPPNSLVDPAHFDHISPITRFGSGIKRAIKPEIYFPGGRQLMHDVLPTQNMLRITQYNAAPGIITAAPAVNGSLVGTSFQRGTSFAAALCTHYSLKVIDFLDKQRSIGKNIPTDFDHLLIKALIINSADTLDFLAQTKSLLADMGLSPWASAEMSYALGGFGKAQPERALGSTDHKVTAIAHGQIIHEKSMEFKFPIPDSLGGKRGLRRVTTTLTWSSAINPNSQKYRASALFTDINGTSKIGCNREGVYEKPTRRGSVEHSIYNGDIATSFTKGSEIIITVNCREDGLRHRDPVPFALVVTMETEERDDLKIYQDIKARIQSQVRTIVKTQGS